MFHIKLGLIGETFARETFPSKQIRDFVLDELPQIGKIGETYCEKKFRDLKILVRTAERSSFREKDRLHVEI